MPEAQARAGSGEEIQVRPWEMSRTGRAVCEGDTAGFLKIVAKDDGTLFGATVVHVRWRDDRAVDSCYESSAQAAGLASAIRPYPT